MAPVLIIGAGLSGLCLAQGLRRLNVDFKVFERDIASDRHRQGYRVRIDEGATAILNSVPEDIAELFKISNAVNPPTIKRYDAITGEDRAPSGGPPRVMHHISEPNVSTVDRGVLRDVLMVGIEDRVIFGKPFSHYKLVDDGVVVHFTDGTSEHGRMLIGADGRSSRVKKQYLPNHHLLDSDGGIIFGKTVMTPELEEMMERRVLKGMVLLTDTTSYRTPLVMLLEKTFWSDHSRNSIREVELPEDYIYWALVTQRGTLWPGREDDHIDLEQVISTSIEMTKHWDADYRKILELQDKDRTSFTKILSAQPDMEAWKPSRFITLVGDAAHAMPPTAASGANTALKDIEELIQKIESVGIDNLTNKVIGEYEEDMRKRAGERIMASFGAGAGGFGQKKLEECRVVKV